MTGMDLRSARNLVVGGLTRPELLGLLTSAGVLLNAHAETLLADPAFDDSGAPTVIRVVERSVADLGLADGASLSQIHQQAESRGLRLCPPTTAPYLRLALRDQSSEPDDASSGRAPSGSLTVAAPALRNDDEYPKGFYLRVIEGRQWLRGYRCDDEHLWSPQDRFAFRTAG